MNNITQQDTSRANLACDFCNGPATVFFRCQPVTQRICGALLGWSRRSWRACDTCRALIASGHRDRLVDRSLAAGPAPNRQGRRALRSSTRRLQDAFWSARTDAHPVALAVAAVSDR